MVDNVRASASTNDGATFATDDDGTAHHPYVKIEFGADDTQTPVSTANPLPVDLGTNNDVVATGPEADNAAVASNPLLVAGRYDITPATRGDGDVTTLQTDATGALKVTGGGGGTEYTQDAAHADPATAATWLMPRDDALATQETTDGDWTLPRANARGAQWVAIDDTATGLATAANQATNIGHLSDISGNTNALETSVDVIETTVYADDADWTDGTSAHLLVGGLYQSTPQTVTDGDVAPFNITTNGAMHVAQQGTVTVDGSGVTQPVSGTVTANPASGTIDTVTTVTAVTDITNTIDSTISGAALTALQLIDNAVHVDDAAFTLGTSSGVMAMGFAGTQSVNANDAAALSCETDGSLHIHDGGNTITVDGTVAVTGVATAANQLPDGHNVTIDNASGASAVNIQDGGNSITVDGTLTTVSTVTNLSQMGGVAITRGNGASGTGVQRVTIASDSTGQVKLAAGTAEIGKLAAGTASIGILGANSGTDIGDVTINNASGASAVNIQDGGNSITVDGTISAALFQPSSHYRNIDANAEAAIKSSAGTLHWIHAMNMTAAVAYLHLYDATTGNVTPGTTVPDFTFPIPTQGDTNGAGFVMSFGGGAGQSFANAITLVVTTTTDGSTGDPGTNGVFINAGYR